MIDRNFFETFNIIILLILHKYISITQKSKEVHIDYRHTIYIIQPKLTRRAGVLFYIDKSRENNHVRQYSVYGSYGMNAVIHC